MTSNPGRIVDRFHHLFIAPSDYEASLVFYRDILGWTITDGWVNDGSTRGVMLSGGGVKVVLAERRGKVAHHAPLDGGSRPTLHLDIHDLDARFRMLPKGDHVVTPPENTRWGTRWFVVRDPDGNLIAFEELHGRTGHPAPQQP